MHEEIIIIDLIILHLKASESKWVNSVLNIIGVNLLRIEGLPFSNFRL